MQCVCVCVQGNQRLPGSPGVAALESLHASRAHVAGGGRRQRGGMPLSWGKHEDDEVICPPEKQPSALEAYRPRALDHPVGTFSGVERRVPAHNNNMSA